jgi:hypothetical protein
VNNIVAKLILALFPPNSPFQRLKMDPKVEAQAKAKDPKAKQALEADLAQIDRDIASDFETQGFRPHLNEALKHLVVGGNILLHMPEPEDIEMNQSMRVFHLDRYVVKRDPSGRLLEIVVKEPVSPKSLDSMLYSEVRQLAGYQGDDKTCDLYTYIALEYNENGKAVHWKICQEIHGLKVPGSEGQYPLGKLPWLALRWNKIDGEDYGRGYCEDHLGDLQSAEGLAQAIVEGSSAAAKLLIFVNPNGVTKADEIEKAPNGAVRTGNAADITLLRLEKHNDFSVAADTAANIEKRLSQAFMLNSSAQRSGERVTAEEWRFMIQDIEDALGGIYSVLASELQLPLVTIHIGRLQKQKKIPSWPKDSVKPIIVTGLEALGRSHDLESLRSFMKDFFTTLTPAIAVRYIHADDLAKRLAAGSNLDITGLVKTEEEMAEMAQQEAQQAQQQQIMEMVQKLGPAGIKAMTEKGMGNGTGSEGAAAVAGAPAA